MFVTGLGPEIAAQQSLIYVDRMYYQGSNHAVINDAESTYERYD